MNEYTPWYREFWAYVILCLLVSGVLGCLSLVYYAFEHPDPTVQIEAHPLSLATQDSIRNRANE